MAVTQDKAKWLLSSVKMDVNGNFYDIGTWYSGIHEDMKDSIIMAVNAIDENAKIKDSIKKIKDECLKINEEKMEKQDIMNMVMQIIDSYDR